MPLGNSLPSWLNIGPTDYLHAIQAGTQAGLEVNRQRALAEEAAARRELAQQEAQRQAWEFGETMRQKAIENQQQQEYQSGLLNWHQQQLQAEKEKAAQGLSFDQTKFAETMRHNKALEAKDASPAAVKTTDAIFELEDKARQAEAMGDVPQATLYRDKAKLLREDMMGSGFEITGWDDQGRPIMRYGKGSLGTATVATQSRSQQKLQKYENAMELVNRLQQGLEAGHVGLAGVGGEYLWDRGLVQLLNLAGAPATADPNRVSSRAALKMLSESLLREVSDDNRFSNLDREEISKALPSSGTFESLSDAQAKLGTIRDILTKRGRVYGRALDTTPPLWTLSQDEIRSLYKQNKIDKTQALDALERFH